ncbi:hypothetical protein GA0061070_1005113 [Kosakonia oryziphila]|uniref:Uncharacterized protein n=1 Tax=Kosakonia oryziphila TaxID=1005667 RepID=A0A1C4AU43_9ENTR|nr:hypothetical protein GA0061070_1005113 [Kosakonia oryziphila]
MAETNRSCFRDIIRTHIQITIPITIINKMDVTVSIHVKSLT